MPVISTNTAANSALRYLNINSSEQTQALNRIASGSKITSAADDAAGLAVSMKVQNDVAVLNQAQTNASHASAMLETADGALSEVADILERMKVLATSSLSGAVESERASIDAEYQKLLEELDDIASDTEFNGTVLLDGTYDSAVTEGDLSGTAAATVNVASTLTTGDTLSFVYDSKTVTATMTNGSFNLQADVNAALKDAGLDGDEISVSLDSGTGDVTLTETTMDNKLSTTANTVVYTDTETSTATTATATAGTAAVLTFSGIGATGTNAITDGDAVSFEYDGHSIQVTISDDLANLQADVDVAMAEYGYAAGTVTADASTADLVLTDTTGSLDMLNGVFSDKDSTSGGKTLDFMVGVSSDDVISVNLADVRTSALGLDSAAGTVALSGTSVDTVANAESALDSLDEAVSQVAEARAELGAQMSRFEYRADSLATTEENLDAAQSAITDSDLAEEQANLSSAQVLTNAAIAALAQANEMPQDLLRLVQ